MAAEMRLAHAPAVEHDTVARLPFGMARTLDHAGEIDPRNHREAAHDRRLPGDRKPILVVYRRPFDRDRDVAVHQVLLVEIDESDALALLGLVDADCLEGHACLARDSGWVRQSGADACTAQGQDRRPDAAAKPRNPGAAFPDCAPLRRAPTRPPYAAAYAAAGSAGATGFSTIGRLTTAESTPNSTASHHTTS